VLHLALLMGLAAALAVLWAGASVAVRAGHGRHPWVPTWLPFIGLAFVTASTASYAVGMAVNYREEAIDWATKTARDDGVPFVFPTDQVAAGTRVFVTIAVLCLVVAGISLALAMARIRRVRAGRAVGASSKTDSSRKT
jgi:hypothetical protein